MFAKFIKAEAKSGGIFRLLILLPATFRLLVKAPDALCVCTLIVAYDLRFSLVLKLYIANFSLIFNGIAENMGLEVSKLKLSVFIACLFLMTTSAFATDNAVTKQSQDPATAKRSASDGKEVLMNKVSQSEEQRDRKTFQVATIVIDASPETVFKTFTDYKRSPEIFSYLKKAKILSVNGSKKTISCEAEIVGGLFRFQYVLEFTEHAPNLVEWHRLSGAFKSNEGYWKFESIDKGQFTLVTYSKYIDGGFLFPQFLVKKELHDNMPVILNELKHSVEADVKKGLN
jgi:ribosome-associated toxin RatA of RatAB toxin-antitoxin module